MHRGDKGTMSTPKPTTTTTDLAQKFDKVERKRAEIYRRAMSKGSSGRLANTKRVVQGSFVSGGRDDLSSSSTTSEASDISSLVDRNELDLPMHQPGQSIRSWPTSSRGANDGYADDDGDGEDDDDADSVQQNEDEISLISDATYTLKQEAAARQAAVAVEPSLQLQPFSSSSSRDYDDEEEPERRALLQYDTGPSANKFSGSGGSGGSAGDDNDSTYAVEMQTMSTSALASGEREAAPSMPSDPLGPGRLSYVVDLQAEVVRIFGHMNGCCVTIAICVWILGIVAAFGFLAIVVAAGLGSNAGASAAAISLFVTGMLLFYGLQGLRTYNYYLFGPWYGAWPYLMFFIVFAGNGVATGLVGMQLFSWCPNSSNYNLGIQYACDNEYAQLMLVFVGACIGSGFSLTCSIAEFVLLYYRTKYMTLYERQIRDRGQDAVNAFKQFLDRQNEELDRRGRGRFGVPALHYVVPRENKLIY